MNLRSLLNFFFELGHLRRIKHEGWRIAGIDRPESVADHSLRVAQIGYILAHMEGYKNPHLISTILIFHDMGECRIGDIHKIANRYIEANEKQAVQDQISHLPKPLQKDLLDMWCQIEERSTDAGHIAKDADLLEQALMAKEYITQGYEYAIDWITNIEAAVTTTSAKKLLKELKTADPHEWWQGLKKINIH